jgi:2-amino-4-hydroxy-6-hydroxymethyldihydropteridine diphosphokinase
MRNKLNNELTLFFTKNYPFVKKNIKIQKQKKFNSVIGIGGNIGNVKLRFRQLFTVLNNNKNIDIIKTSPILENPPFGYLKQKKFLNSVVLINTDYKPFQLLKFLQKVEYRLGRRRSFKDAPRTIDLDILFFSDNYKSINNNKKVRINTEKLTIPHLHWNERVSVVIPLLLIK